MQIIRNNATYPGMLNGLGVIVDDVVSTGGGAIAYETKMAAILVNVAFQVTDGTLLAGVVTNSTTYPGTKVVTYTAVAGKSYQVFIVGSNGYATTTGTVSSTATITDTEVY